jgi:hypothetical protein
MTCGSSEPLATVGDRCCPRATVAAWTQRGPGSGDFLRARDNPGEQVTWANAPNCLLTCAVD